MIIPDNVTSIGIGAFLYCSAITKIIIPDNITTIEKWTFEGCTSLSEIIIPEGVTEIVWSAFSDCSNLTIKGPAGSYAETYSKENDIPFVAV